MKKATPTPPVNDVRQTRWKSACQNGNMCFVPKEVNYGPQDSRRLEDHGVRPNEKKLFFRPCSACGAKELGQTGMDLRSTSGLRIRVWAELQAASPQSPGSESFSGLGSLARWVVIEDPGQQADMADIWLISGFRFWMDLATTSGQKSRNCL